MRVSMLLLLCAVISCAWANCSKCGYRRCYTQRKTTVCTLKEDGSSECRNNGQCTVKGDPHLKTFDGQKLTYQGISNFSLLEYLDADDKDKSFSVKLETRGRDKETREGKVSYVKSVTVSFGGDTVKLAYQPDYNEPHVVYVNGNRYELEKFMPKKKNMYHIVFHEGDFVISTAKKQKRFVCLQTSLGLTVCFDSRSYLVVHLDNDYKEKVAGLCGNFDDVETNDLRLANGTVYSPSDVRKYKKKAIAREVWQSWQVGSGTMEEADEECTPDHDTETFCNDLYAISCGETKDVGDCMEDVCLEEGRCGAAETFYIGCQNDDGALLSEEEKDLKLRSQICDKVDDENCEFCLVARPHVPVVARP